MGVAIESGASLSLKRLFDSEYGLLLLFLLLPLFAFALRLEFWALVDPFALFLFKPARGSYGIESPPTFCPILIFFAPGIFFGYSNERIRMGLGPATVQGSARRHGGLVVAHGRPGQVAAFKFSLSRIEYTGAGS